MTPTPPVARHARAAIDFGSRASLRIAVVADTHSRPHPATDERLRALAPDAIVHAGDIGDLAVLDQLARHAPVFAVRGNIDERVVDLPDHLTLEVTAGTTVLATLWVTHIAVAGPRVRADAARLAREARASVLVCGHSHVPFLTRDKGLVVFNPGSIGPRRFTLPIVFGVIEIDRARVAIHHVDCETGARWVPARA